MLKRRSGLIFSSSQTFEASPEEPYRILYRVQNSEGNGPYRPSMLIPGGVATGSNPEYVWAEDAHNLNTGRPDPGHDSGFDDAAIGIMNNVFLPIPIFGFSTLAQLQAWFTPSELEMLKEQGYEIQKLKARRIWCSGRQAFCHPGEYSEEPEW